MIFLLMVKIFSMTIHISQLESRQKELIQKMALDQKENEEMERKLKELSAGQKEQGEETDGGNEK